VERVSKKAERGEIMNNNLAKEFDNRMNVTIYDYPAHTPPIYDDILVILLSKPSKKVFVYESRYYGGGQFDLYDADKLAIEAGSSDIIGYIICRELIHEYSCTLEAGANIALAKEEESWTN
jgi:hypothetical protein